MHLSHIPQCSIQKRNVHISVLNGALWDMEQVHSRICEIGLLLALPHTYTPLTSLTGTMPRLCSSLVPHISGVSNNIYRKVSNTRHTKSQNSNNFRVGRVLLGQCRASVGPVPLWCQGSQKAFLSRVIYNKYS